MQFGTTFSHRHADHLGISSTDALKKLSSLNLEYIRLGVYWDESEPKPGKYNFSNIKKILKQCQQQQQKVVLTVGMKAPRWPEYYMPLWAPQNAAGAHPHVLSFIQAAITQLQSFDCIAYWQVENEPLDKSGPVQQTISVINLMQEVRLVRSLDNRPIHLNTYAFAPWLQGKVEAIASLADTVGLDIYYQSPTSWWPHWYMPRKSPDFLIKRGIHSTTKPVWLTELQAEPWERQYNNYLNGSPQSITPEKIIKNIHNGQKLGAEAIFLWGCEYWLYRLHHGDSRWWNAVKGVIGGGE